MPRGSAPGENRGAGRPKGAPNKKTLIQKMVNEALETPMGRDALAAAIHKLSQPPKGTKKALDTLREMTELSVVMVNLFKPQKNKKTGKETVKDHDRLLQYLSIAVRSSAELATFESPKFKAVTVPEIPPMPESSKTSSKTEDLSKGSQQDAAAVYMRLVRGGKAA